MQATYEYGARGELPPVTLTWYQGDDKPEIWTDRRHPAVGQTACSSSATRGCCSPITQAPAAAGEGVRRLSSGPSRSSRSRSAITPNGFTPARPASRPRCNFEYAGWLTEANHLGNVAYRAGKKLEWDPVNHAGDQRAGGRAVHPPRVSQGLGSHPLVLTSAAANRSVRVPSIVAGRPGGDRARSA